MQRCFFEGCDNDSEYIDDSDCYVCESCMERILSEEEYGGQEPEDFEKLDWDKYPDFGYPASYNDFKLPDLGSDGYFK